MYAGLQGEDKDRLEICQHAIREKGTVNQTVVQATLDGFATSGKTTFLKKLQGIKTDENEPRTGIMVKPVEIVLRRSTTVIGSPQDTEWLTISTRKEYAAFISDHLAQNKSWAKATVTGSVVAHPGPTIHPTHSPPGTERLANMINYYFCH